MNAAPHESRSKLSPMRSPPTPMSDAECASRLGLNSGTPFNRKQKLRSVVLVQHHRPAVGARFAGPRCWITYARRQLLAKADIAASRVSA
jgi:hypothetical protein